MLTWGHTISPEPSALLVLLVMFLTRVVSCKPWVSHTFRCCFCCRIAPFPVDTLPVFIPSVPYIFLCETVRRSGGLGTTWPVGLQG